MKLPKYLDKKHGVKVVMTDKGVYTTQVQCIDPQYFEQSLKWVRKHGKKYLEKKLGYKIKDVSYKETINRLVEDRQ